MIRLYIININNTDYYNFAESVNISLYLKSLEKYSPFPINKDYHNYNINPDYDNLQTIINTEEQFYFIRLIQIQFEKYHLHDGWFKFNNDILSEVKKFISPFILTNNSSVITEDALYKCTICNKRTFSNTKSLNQHISMCSNNFKCNTCGKDFISQTCYNNHTKVCHIWECTICNKQFASKQVLEKHILNCGKFKCTTCSLTFNTKHKYLNHCQTIHDHTPII